MCVWLAITGDQGLALLGHPEKYVECFLTCPPERRTAGALSPGTCAPGWLKTLSINLALLYCTCALGKEAAAVSEGP